jgi:hypothetical protein
LRRTPDAGRALLDAVAGLAAPERAVAPAALLRLVL